MQSTGQASTQAVSLVPMQGSAITYAIDIFSRVLIHSTGERETQFQFRSKTVESRRREVSEPLRSRPCCLLAANSPNLNNAPRSEGTPRAGGRPQGLSRPPR